MFTLKICLPLIIIILIVLFGVIVNLINGDHVFKHTERRGKA